MTIKEKIALSENIKNLVLYKEGIFYKLYNQHAMLFAENIRAFKVNVKFIKSVRQDVYSVGFPVSSFDLQSGNEKTSIKQLLQKFGSEIREHEDRVEIANIEWENNPAYRQWCLQQMDKQISNNNNKMMHDFENLKQRILGFQVVNKTPMQAFEFILELQKEL